MPPKARKIEPADLEGQAPFDTFKTPPDLFVQVPKSIYTDNILSADAVYLWGKMKSFPLQSNFRIRLKDFWKLTVLGRDACYKAQKQLMREGFLTKHCNPKTPDGDFNGYTIVLHWEAVSLENRTY